MNTDIKFMKDDSTFTQVLHNRVNAYFRDHGHAPFATPSMVAKTLIMCSLLFGSYTALLVIDTSWLGVIGIYFLISLGIVGVALNIVHDAAHSAYSNSAFINNMLSTLLNIIGGYAPNWRVQHNILHHVYTNIFGLDEDIDSRGALSLSPYGRKRQATRYQHLFAAPLYSLALLYWTYVKDFRQFTKYRDLGLLKDPSKHRIGIVISKTVSIGGLLIVPLTLPNLNWHEVLSGYLVMQLSAGFIATMTFQLAHVNEVTEFFQPRSNGEVEAPWMEEQMRSTSNFATDNRFVTWAIGGLNHQVEHHLLPHICHVHYPKLAPLVRQTAEEFGIPYHEIPTIGQALGSHFRRLKQIGGA